jgi:FkbM family methyltransferase
MAIEAFAAVASDSDRMLDIGAYTGIFTLVACVVNPSMHAIAFEIVPEVYDLLFENIKQNGLQDRAEAVLAGIGAPGASMRIPSRLSGSALPDFLSSETRFEDGVAVTFRSLDSIQEHIGAADAVCMKIDVEGTEDEVFAHGRTFVERYRPDILCEVLPEARDPGAVQALLGSLGYAFYRIGDQGIRREDRLRGDQRYRDWLFTCRDAEDLRALGVPIEDTERRL